jgi:hypothetical protein
MRLCPAVTVISDVPTGIGRELGLRHVMNKGGHRCVDKTEYLSVVLMEGVEEQVACEDCTIEEEKAKGRTSGVGVGDGQKMRD